MPRPPRLHVPGAFYHLGLRGNHRERTFATAADRRALAEIVGDALERYRARLHAFCFLSNHLHFLLQASNVPTAKVMQRIAQRYSRYRHRRLFLTGQLYDKRYWSRLIDVDNYFRAVLRYIHLNPVAAGMVADAD